MTVDIFYNSIKFQLDSGSDISIINWRTWGTLNKPTLLKTDKTAKSVTGDLDNILVTSKTIAEHRNHIINVFKKLQEYGFTVNEAKGDFFLPEIKYLGHIINRDGRRPDPESANVIRNMPAPANIQASQSFLCLANFYQGFIKNTQNFRGPLNEHLKKDRPWL